ncbi:uncharacterized protein Z518_01968 [Rhinocladiella mackenziei CBS 650.93]|uniref:Rhinocladiella mackenziei CBS 650.93 unplaced genomic scaffold supercont1.2, whole genome shotgun sequence n=1 Tax=Rhinocladiella mackenziei CBS 650.93 TaxID=1442369 RepID=A0A0D2JDN8_9EURO|nr:uncharacterized protein Z518_01968 [Rhinocladiella mackenziei CBS 650.93]KIX07315.1 hypothetical protein Z518_01968 [Rhinocladiella mackenziei CBS 650.93]
MPVPLSEPTSTAPIPGMISIQDSLSLPSDSSPVNSMSGFAQPIDPGLSVEQEVELLGYFFKYIHPAIPLLKETDFYHRYSIAAVDHNLVVTLVVLSAKITRVALLCNQAHLDYCLEKLLDLDYNTNDHLGGLGSLDNFQRACLLAYYEFHQRPGPRAWMRIGQLSRQAYQCGLHQIDNPNNPLSSIISDPSVLEQWRYVWWCIYCLDSYSNISASTPFVIELSSIQTALVNSPLTASAFDRDAPDDLVFLSDEPDSLWKTLKEVIPRPQTLNFNTHIITTTILREAGALFRLSRQSASKGLSRRLVALEQHLSMIQSCMPPGYLDPARNAANNESGVDHHARLVCLLQYHFARILTSTSLYIDKAKPHRLLRWRQVMEDCQDVITTISHWDAQYCSTVDPAICFIAYTTLSLICHFQVSDLAVGIGPQGQLEAQKFVLLQFLQNFACIWALPQTLIALYQQNSERIPRVQSLSEIDRLLDRSRAPYESLPSIASSILGQTHHSPPPAFPTTSQLAPVGGNGTMDHMTLFDSSFDPSLIAQAQKPRSQSNGGSQLWNSIFEFQ